MICYYVSVRVAIVTDWLTVLGGAERVILKMHELWPDAPIFTTVYNESGALDFLKNHIRTSSLQKWYKLIGTHRALLPFMPCAVEALDLRGFDLIVSSSHAVAKGCIPPSEARHICYCHTPVRYAWEMEEEYLEDFRIPRFLRPLVKRELEKLRHWDKTTARRVDHFIANSRTTQERIKRIYKRESDVLHPPVEDRFFDLPLVSMQDRNDFYLTVGRLVPYKRFDLLIKVANEKQLPLKIAGDGPEKERLRKIAGPTVEVLGRVTEEDLGDLYTHAKAFLFPTFEDAGIVPLEAQACGTPVIALKKGGALDTVKEGETGLFFAEQSIGSIAATLDAFDEKRFDPKVVRKHAERFSSEQFKRGLQTIVQRMV